MVGDINLYDLIVHALICGDFYKVANLSTVLIRPDDDYKSDTIYPISNHYYRELLPHIDMAKHTSAEVKRVFPKTTQMCCYYKSTQLILFKQLSRYADLVIMDAMSLNILTSQLDYPYPNFITPCAFKLTISDEEQKYCDSANLNLCSIASYDEVCVPYFDPYPPKNVLSNYNRTRFEKIKDFLRCLF